MKSKTNTKPRKKNQESDLFKNNQRAHIQHRRICEGFQIICAFAVQYVLQGEGRRRRSWRPDVKLGRKGKNESEIYDIVLLFVVLQVSWLSAGGDFDGELSFEWRKREERRGFRDNAGRQEELE